MKTTMHVLIAVAKFESTFSMPAFAKIDVQAAKTEESIANKNHMKYPVS